MWCLVANYLSFSLSVLWVLFPDLLLPGPPSVDLEMQVKPARSSVNDVWGCVCVWWWTCVFLSVSCVSLTMAATCYRQSWPLCSSLPSFLAAVLKDGRWIKKVVFCCWIVPVLQLPPTSDCADFDQLLLVCVISAHAVTARWLVCVCVMNCIRQVQLPRWQNRSQPKPKDHNNGCTPDLIFRMLNRSVWRLLCLLL